MENNKKYLRGYNQTELITDILCEKLSITNGKNYISKIKNTKVQSTLDYNGRKENIKNAFLVNNKNELYGKKVIIFDDICTTGSTVNEIAKILKNVGVNNILVIVLAKD